MKICAIEAPSTTPSDINSKLPRDIGSNLSRDIGSKLKSDFPSGIGSNPPIRIGSTVGGRSDDVSEMTYETKLDSVSEKENKSHSSFWSKKQSLLLLIYDSNSKNRGSIESQSTAESLVFSFELLHSRVCQQKVLWTQLVSCFIAKWIPAQTTARTKTASMQSGTIGTLFLIRTKVWSLLSKQGKILFSCVNWWPSSIDQQEQKLSKRNWSIIENILMDFQAFVKKVFEGFWQVKRERLFGSSSKRRWGNLDWNSKMVQHSIDEDGDEGSASRSTAV